MWSALVFDHGTLNHPFVETRLKLHVADPEAGGFQGLRPVGRYLFVTRLDGTIEDDSLVLDEPGQVESRRSRPPSE